MKPTADLRETPTGAKGTRMWERNAARALEGGRGGQKGRHKSTVSEAQQGRLGPRG
jgi:hypothetical protein